jgi:molybdopterin-guanine dinucleotide biosynthesis protein A
MGIDKAELLIAGERLADRAARVLRAVCEPSLEVGPGRSALPAVAEAQPGAGPLVALVAGADAVRGRADSVVLLAVDLPFVQPPLLQLLVERSGAAIVVPIADGQPQPCCARYSAGALTRARELVAAGERSLRALLAATEVDPVPETVWRAVAPAHALDDLDTPADLARHGLTHPR